jgi:hypothetical protein
VTGTSSREMKVLASAVVDRVRGQLIGAQHGCFRVQTCIHYGAVEIDPKHLVVWLLLAGAPDDQLPEWFSPGAPADHPGRNQHLDPSLVSWLESLRRGIRAEFAASQWPEPDSVQVLFDSDHRVQEGGGFWYFK